MTDKTRPAVWFWIAGAFAVMTIMFVLSCLEEDKLNRRITVLEKKVGITSDR